MSNLSLARQLLREALYRLEHPRSNYRGQPLQVGAIYWRLAKVLADIIDPLLNEYEGEDHAQYLRSHHGVNYRGDEANRARGSSLRMENAKRDAKIVCLRASGLSYRECGEPFGLGVARIGQILARAKRVAPHVHDEGELAARLYARSGDDQ